jgi:anti-sigma B factor antagonist
MNVNKRQKGDVTILDLSGKITIGAGDIALRNAVQEAMTAGAQKILLNLKGVSTIDSSGVGELVSSFMSTSNRGVKLKLSELPAKVSDVLVITQLITVFDVYDKEDEAVASFA